MTVTPGDAAISTPGAAPRRRPPNAIARTAFAVCDDDRSCPGVVGAGLRHALTRALGTLVVDVSMTPTSLF